MTDNVIQGEGFTVKESKFDFFFGRVTSDPNNTQRSFQNLRELRRLGIDETASGRERLLQIFKEGLDAPEIAEDRRVTEYGTSITRKVEIISPEVTGSILIRYFYPNSDLSLIPQVTSLVPKIYQ
ncbi:hypothetical protein [Argonema galeatum]|uniref:hypothetical protein n=1 Tax=Argonema galeatum TaxID=2942762 RepID=UPI002011D4DD|nr:hypothetical protein [Argonema galeatum]MCL1465288.1 hypothetical protein [Argonema galeatum A003/A1]